MRAALLHRQQPGGAPVSSFEAQRLRACDPPPSSSQRSSTVLAYVKRAGKPKPDHLDGKPDHLDGGAGHAGGLGAGAPWQHHPAACLRPQSGEKSGLCRGVHAHAIPCRVLTVLGTACTLQFQQSPAIMHIPWIQHLMLIASLLPCRQAWTPPQSSGRAS